MKPTTENPVSTYIEVCTILKTYCGWKFWLNTTYCPLTESQKQAVKYFYYYCERWTDAKSLPTHIHAVKTAIPILKNARSEYNHWLATELLKINKRHGSLLSNRLSISALAEQLYIERKEVKAKTSIR